MARSTASFAINFPGKIMISHPHNTPLLPDPSSGPVRAVLDTDTFNEVDDQFALAYTLFSPERIQLEACYAAPFLNVRSSSPEEGMLKSYIEIQHVLELMESDWKGEILHGSRQYLSSPERPVKSPAVRDLIDRAMNGGPEPLYVMAIAVATNIASALLIEPAIRDRIVVLWLGGHPYSWPTAREFNLEQDVLAAQVLFDSGVPLVHVPCKKVAERLDVTPVELNMRIGGSGRLCSYLERLFCDYVRRKQLVTKPLWDVAVPALLIDRRWAASSLEPSPVLTDEMLWRHENDRHAVRVVTDLNRSAILSDLFQKLRVGAEAVPPLTPSSGLDPLLSNS